MRKPINKQKVESRRYKQLKKKYQEQLSSETLKKFKILNEAFEIGCKLKGRDYTYVNLSLDFDIPYTTCNRILSLRKANKRTWKLIKEKKITSFKVVQILLQKNIVYQDELIDIVIEKKLSTYEIKNLKDNSLKEVYSNRVDVALNRGFSRRSVALKSFLTYLERVNSLTLIEYDDLPPTKIKKLKKELEKTEKNIKKFIHKLSK